MKDYNQFLNYENSRNFTVNYRITEGEIIETLGTGEVVKHPFSEEKLKEIVLKMDNQAITGRSVLDKLKASYESSKMEVRKFMFIAFLFLLLPIVSGGFSIATILSLLISALCATVGVSKLRTKKELLETIEDIAKNDIYVNLDREALQEALERELLMYDGLSSKAKEEILTKGQIAVDYTNIESVPLTDMEKIEKNLKEVQGKVKSHRILPINDNRGH